MAMLVKLLSAGVYFTYQKGRAKFLGIQEHEKKWSH